MCFYIIPEFLDGTSIRIAIAGYFSLKFEWYSPADSYFAGKLFVNSMMSMCVT